MQDTIATKLSSSEILRRAIADLKRSGELSPQIEIGPDFESKSIDDIGLDSVGRLALVVSIEEALGIVLSDEELTTGMTIGDIAQLIDRRMSE